MKLCFKTWLIYKMENYIPVKIFTGNLSNLAVSQTSSQKCENGKDCEDGRNKDYTSHKYHVFSLKNEISNHNESSIRIPLSVVLEENEEITLDEDIISFSQNGTYDVWYDINITSKSESFSYIELNTEMLSRTKYYHDKKGFHVQSKRFILNMKAGDKLSLCSNFKGNITETNLSMIKIF
jgi:hypothetical protein